MIRRIVLAALGILSLVGAAHAQGVTYPIPPGFAAHSSGTASLSASNTSSRVAITSAPIAWVQNAGSTTVCVNWGDSTVVAAYTCPQQNQIYPGQVGTFAVLGAADLAAVTVTPSATATLSIVLGYIELTPGP